ncbi:MAG: polysaccharide biosynthesis/export family protein [Cellvibrionaceae bacterium]
MCGILAGCGSTKDVTTSGQAAISNQVVLIDQYKIGVDDQVQVNVWKNPDLSITVPVRPDGRISVPLIGEVVAGGRTPVEVAADITKQLSGFIKDPQVAVILTDLRSHEFLSRVRVTGAVQAPRSFPYRQGMSVLDVVLEAGGLDEFASGNSARLYRKSSGKVSTIRIRLEDILDDGDMKTNLLIQPGDILSIPERIF